MEKKSNSQFGDVIKLPSRGLEPAQGVGPTAAEARRQREQIEQCTRLFFQQLVLTEGIPDAPIEPLQHADVAPDNILPFPTTRNRPPAG